MMKNRFSVLESKLFILELTCDSIFIGSVAIH